MNKQKFNSLLQNYNSIADEDRQGLQELAKSFPYSQVIQTLVAKADHDAKSSNASNSLNRAAMYATDRQILKAVILSGATPKVVVQVKEPKPEQRPVQKESTSVQINQSKQVHISISKDSFSQPSELLRNEIWADLEHLKESKAIYLDWLEKSEEDEVKTEKTPIKRAEIQKEKPTTLKKAVSKVVKETKKATSKKTSPKKETAGIKAATEKKTKAAAKKAPVNKTATSKMAAKTTEKKAAAEKTEVKKKAEVKSKPAKPALEEQIKIIDTFIDKKPSISSRAVKTVDNDQKDLSVDSTTFGEDLISENLAHILIEQGKNEKAIDIYKKLIWKFPQKKSYFAAQIEALTK